MNQAYTLGNDSELRLLLGYSGPPRAGRITAVNPTSYTVEIADADNAAVEAWPLNGAVYAEGNIVYVLQAENAPDSGVIIGRKGSLTRLGVGIASPDIALHVRGPGGGGGIAAASAIDGTEQTLLSARITLAVAGTALVGAGGLSGVLALSLVKPGSSYSAQNVTVSGNTVEFRCYANGDLRVVRTAGSNAATASLTLVWL
jgi:hypothetical protein